MANYSFYLYKTKRTFVFSVFHFYKPRKYLFYQYLIYPLHHYFPFRATSNFRIYYRRVPYLRKALLRCLYEFTVFHIVIENLQNTENKMYNSRGCLTSTSISNSLLDEINVSKLKTNISILSQNQFQYNVTFNKQIKFTLPQVNTVSMLIKRK